MELDNQPTGISRRAMLSLLGVGATSALLTACQSAPTSSRLLSDLPDPFLPVPRSPAPVKQIPQAPVPVTPKPPMPAPAPAFQVLARSAWTRTGPVMKKVQPMEGIRLITYHHSGDPKPFTTTDYAETVTHLENVRKFHVGQGFQDIGYHYAIDRAGRVWQLRPTDFRGEHVKPANDHNLGIVVLGNFNKQTMSAAQKEMVITFGSAIRAKLKLAANRVYTHMELKGTDCPGNDMQPFMVQVRKQGKV